MQTLQYLRLYVFGVYHFSYLADSNLFFFWKNFKLTGANSLRIHLYFSRKYQFLNLSSGANSSKIKKSVKPEYFIFHNNLYAGNFNYSEKDFFKISINSSALSSSENSKTIRVFLPLFLISTLVPIILLISSERRARSGSG